MTEFPDTPIPHSTTHVYRPVTKIKRGDIVHWWGNDVEVLGVDRNGETTCIIVDDPVTGQKSRRFEYANSDALMARIST